MTNHHLSDTELQMVANAEQLADAAAMRHIESCALCQEQLAAYKLLLGGLHEQAPPAFDFDLSGIVLQQLPPVRVKKVFPYRTIIIAAFIVIPFYLFRKNFFLLTAGISTLFLLLSVASCVIIIGFHIAKLYHKYHRQLDQLNISE